MSLICSTISRRVAVLAAMALCLCSGVSPQSQIQLQFAQAQRANAQAMRKYAWKSRVEVRKNRETKNVRLYLVRHDLDGTLQRTPIGGSPKPELPTRGIRGRVAQKKLKSFQETVEELLELVKSYSSLPSANMQDFLVGRPLGGSDDLQIQGKSVLHTGDSMTIWIDSASQKQKRMEITTSMDGKPVHAVSDFRNLPEGLSYVARLSIDYPAEQLQVITENFEYERQTP
jgi:hypothetical protein